MEFKKLALVDQRMLSDRQQRDSDPITNSLSDLDSEMKRILDANLDDNEKVILYNQTLSRYRDVLAKSREPVTLEIKDKNPNLTSSTPSLRRREDILHVIPKTLKNKASSLLDRISNTRGISWNDKGELVVGDQAIEGSDIVDLVDDIVRTRKREPPRGWQEFADALADLNLPAALIGNTDRWNYMHGTTPVKTSPVIKKRVKWTSNWMLIITQLNVQRAILVM